MVPDMSKRLRVCVSGATGWAGRAVTCGILDSADMMLVGAVARSVVGKDIGVALGRPEVGVAISADVATALRTPTDVFIDYTTPTAVKTNALVALALGVPVVIGTSGLTAADFQELETAATAAGVGVIASGNFSLTAALATHFSLLAAKYLPHWEILDYASAKKIDVPSGTARELAERIADVRRSEIGRPIGELIGPTEARGADIAGSRVHSIRLPSYVVSFECIFGLPDERLTLRHDAGSSAVPYVGGTLLAARQVGRLKGLVRGLDRLLFPEQAQSRSSAE